MKGLKISVGLDPVYKFGVARVFSSAGIFH